MGIWDICVRSIPQISRAYLRMKMIPKIWFGMCVCVFFLHGVDLLQLQHVGRWWWWWWLSQVCRCAQVPEHFTPVNMCKRYIYLTCFQGWLLKGKLPSAQHISPGGVCMTMSYEGMGIAGIAIIAIIAIKQIPRSISVEDHQSPCIDDLAHGIPHEHPIELHSSCMWMACHPSWILVD